MATMWSAVRAAAVDAGRDADELSLVVRANAHHTSRPIEGDRPAYHGSIEQIAADVRTAFEVGATEVLIDLQGSTNTASEHLDVADAIVAAGDLRIAA